MAVADILIDALYAGRVAASRPCSLAQQRNAEQEENDNVYTDVEPYAEPRRGGSFNGEPDCKSGEQSPLERVVVPVEGQAADQ